MTSPDSCPAPLRAPLPTPGLGKMMAHLLNGCWRAETTPVALDGTWLEEFLPAIIGAGVGALAWRRLRPSARAGDAAARTLQQLQRKQALDARLQERQITRRLESLRAAGVEPLLVKGWATARLYPEAGLRASGDVDLLVRPADKTTVERVFGARVVDRYHPSGWDVKTRVPALYDLDCEAVLARCEHAALEGTRVDVPCAEDHLRIVALHFMRHGAWRPLWACDIAVALETRPPGFSWNRCLGTNVRVADHIACALGVVHQLLGARVEGTPVEARARALPAWLAPAVLREWDAPMTIQHPSDPLFLEDVRALGWGRTLAKRWPNPIQSALERRLSLDWPPPALQSASFAARTFGLLRRRGRDPRI